MAIFLTTTYMAKYVPRSKGTRLLVMAAQWKAKKDLEGREYPCARELGKVSLAESQGELTRSIPIIVQERTKIVPRVI